MTGKPGTQGGYLPQLDGVRALAAGLVVYAHLFPAEPVHDALRGISWGYVGVRLFFVLSGFLITGILLDARAQAPAGARFGALRSFYARRFLRIFPLYFATLAVVLACKWPADSVEAISYLSFTSNWYVCWQGADGLLAPHFWSLAVEEQFYLVWPWLVLCLPRRWVFPTVVAVAALGPVSRLLLVLLRVSGIVITFNTVGCLDTLGAGAVLAYLVRSPGGRSSARFVWGSALAAVPLLFLTVAGPWPTHAVVQFAARDLFWAAVGVVLVSAAARGLPGFLGRVLGGGPVAYLGRISYGIYIFHEFTPAVVPWLLDLVGLPFPPEGYGRAALLTGLSVGMAVVSWHALEAPLNRLKTWFPYGPRAARAYAPPPDPAAPVAADGFAVGRPHVAPNAACPRRA
jgi:peptidoglycan/LPS O-acetylase OafA/YrhL